MDIKKKEKGKQKIYQQPVNRQARWNGNEIVIAYLSPSPYNILQIKQNHKEVQT